MSSILKVNNLGKSFRRFSQEWKRIANWFGASFAPSEETWVLRNVSFSLARGEAIGIVGQNGAGKSTLLKLIVGTLRQTTGNVTIKGRVSAILELGMGFNQELSARDNVVSSGGLLGYSPDQIKEIMPKIEKFAEVGEYFDQPLRTFSSGMQMRVAFALATAIRPEILIVDEALSVGDAYFQAKCYERIARYRKQGMGLLLVSHSVDQVARHCDRAIFIKNGKIELDDTPAKVTNLYLSELFGKKKLEPKSEMISDNSIANSINIGEEDVFSTRPGYRKEEQRFGQGGATILDYLIVSDNQKYPPSLESDTMADFYFRVSFNESFSNVVPGFLLKTHDGVFLYGTNSIIISKGKKSISASSGDILVFKFSMPMILNTGHYMVSFGISSGDISEELVPLERRYDSVIIRVDRTDNFWGITNFGASFEVADGKDDG